MSPIATVIGNSGWRGRVRRPTVGYVGGFDGPAELPRAEAVNPLLGFNPDTFFGGYSPRVNHTPTTADELNTLLTGGTLAGQTLQRGDFITLTAGTNYTSATRRTQTFPLLSGAFTWSDPATWVWVRTSAFATIPPSGRRMASSDLDAVAALTQCARFDSFQNGGGVYPLKVANQATGYCFTGIGGTDDNWTAGNRYMIWVGEVSTQLLFSDMPDGVVLDRVVYPIDPRSRESVPATPNSIRLDCKRAIVRDSWVDAGASRGALGAESGGTENQALNCQHGLGPWLIDNTTLIAAGENVITGGADPLAGSEQLAQGCNPTDVIFQRNYCPSRPAWNINAPESDGYGVVCKNNFELKKGVRWLIEGNVFAYWFGPDQAKPINIKRTNQGGSDTKSRCEDITIRYNMVLEAPTFINFSNEGTADELIDFISVHDNVVVLDQTDEFTNATAPGYAISMGAQSWALERNTMLRVADGGRGSSGMLQCGNSLSAGANAVFSDNIIPNIGSILVRYDGVGGNANGWNTVKTRYTANSGSNNLQIGGSSSSGLGTAFGAAAADNAAAFVDAANGDFTVAPAFATGSSTGGAPGADLATLATKTAGAITGSW